MFTPVQVQAVVHNLLNDTATTPNPGPVTSGTTAPSTTVDVVNATGRTGLATWVTHSLASAGYLPGTASNTTRHQTTTVYYPPRSAAAAALARVLGAPLTVPDPTVAAAHLRVVLGTGFTPPPTLPGASDLSPTGPPGTDQDAMSTLPDSISGATIPCVK